MNATDENILVMGVILKIQRGCGSDTLDSILCEVCLITVGEIVRNEESGSKRECVVNMLPAGRGRLLLSLLFLLQTHHMDLKIL